VVVGIGEGVDHVLDAGGLNYPEWQVCWGVTRAVWIKSFEECVI
jgi:hypothetical protein